MACFKTCVGIKHVRACVRGFINFLFAELCEYSTNICLQAPTYKFVCFVKTKLYMVSTDIVTCAYLATTS